MTRASPRTIAEQTVADWCATWGRIGDPAMQSDLVAVFAAALEADRAGAAQTPRHTDRLTPCPTCGFYVKQVERAPFAYVDDPAHADQPAADPEPSLGEGLVRGVAP